MVEDQIFLGSSQKLFPFLKLDTGPRKMDEGKLVSVIGDEVGVYADFLGAENLLTNVLFRIR